MSHNQNYLYQMFDLSNCKICPHECGVNRNTGTGICNSDSNIKISSYGPHFGEEPELVGRHGSGTIFFSGCNLLCVFCQNYTISHLNEGFSVSCEELSEIMLNLQARGCHNINFVTATHFTPLILKSIKLAKNSNLKIPVVWNSNCYEKYETIRLLKGYVDIYMPDLKFVMPESGSRYTTAKNYFKTASEAIIEMHNQVGNLVHKNGIATRGLIVRHLVMPDNASNTYRVIDFIADNLGVKTYLNLMAQYHPSYKSYHYKEINRRITESEYMKYVRYAYSKGFRNPSYIYGQTETS